jgi:hypothetical protein
MGSLTTNIYNNPVLHIKKKNPLERTPLLNGHNFGNRGCPLKREYTVIPKSPKIAKPLGRLIDITIYLGTQELAFGGHNKNENSFNQGNFRELAKLLSGIYIQCNQLKNKSSRRVTCGNPCYSIGSKANSIYFLNDRSVLIREGKPLYPFLSKLRERRSVRFDIVKVYVEKECRKIKCMYNIQGVPKKRDKSIAPLFIGGF